ncbi:GspE/PulE family protein [Pseudomonas siliginis]|uniref:GspE/PulE family protein n=1 Tax=Pseudomonas siliginis TaxID=2842346 RepID=UPI0020937229|nr:ATPase, T2SS/T4P/T4SS family [Pseudomonas siliginis]UST77203.1 Flp pilus assembly complex ATPase component TadA [Pseudomonas siliginis]
MSSLQAVSIGSIALLQRKPLSAQGELWEADPELRKMVCLTADLKLYVSSSHMNNVFVLGYMERLDYNDVEYTVHKVRVEEVERFYQGTSTDASSSSHKLANGQGTSDFQRMVIQTIAKATELEASDVHLMLEESALEIKYRVHGDLEHAGQLHRTEGGLFLSTIYQSMCEASEEFFKPHLSQDGRLKKEFVGQCGLFGARVATRPMMYGPLMVLRLLYDNGQQRKMEELGYLPEQIAIIRRFIQSKKGIIVVSGVTGSGKSVSLQVFLQELLEHFERKIHLLTVEDPPEYRIDGANQTELGQADWPSSIKNAVRLDPDVLMVGEMRDYESAKAAFQGALTGHGLWTTLHTPDAISSIQRLLDLGVDPTLVLDPSLVKGFINQSLTRVLCPACKIQYYEGKHALKEDLCQRVETFCTPATVFVRGPGCEKCHGKGVSGRTVIAEVLPPDLDFMRVFAKSKAEAKVHWVKNMNGITKNAHAIRQLNAGLVDPYMVEGDVGPLDEDFVTLGGAIKQ